MFIRTDDDLLLNLDCCSEIKVVAWASLHDCNKNVYNVVARKRGGKSIIICREFADENSAISVIDDICEMLANGAKIFNPIVGVYNQEE